MPVTQDIVATYRGPGRVVRRLLDMGPREDRALAFVMAFCVIRFISKAPGIARESHLEGTELNGLLAANLFGSVMLLPLLMYAVAAITYLAFHRFREEITAYSTRVALFWAALASTPLLLLNGLVAGFVGEGRAFEITWLLWFAIFMWFWLSGLIRAEGRPA